MGRRIQELSAAFQNDLPGKPTDISRAPQEFESIEQFSACLQETIRDCRSLSGRTLFHKPKGPELAWAEAVPPLDRIARLIDKDYVPTQRERAEIHRALTGIDASRPNPCPTIHDFISEVSSRFRKIDSYYTMLVTTGRYAGQEAAEVKSVSLACVTLGGEMRVAFAQTDGPKPGIYVCRSEKSVTRERTGEVEFDLMRVSAHVQELDSTRCAGRPARHRKSNGTLTAIISRTSFPALSRK